ncbi:carboxypeptidase-like regulatory domain-containing protein [Nanoarchaeota archaeon]
MKREKLLQKQRLEGKFELRDVPYGKKIEVRAAAEHGYKPGAHIDEGGDDGKGKRELVVLSEGEPDRDKVVVPLVSKEYEGAVYEIEGVVVDNDGAEVKKAEVEIEGVKHSEVKSGKDKVSDGHFHIKFSSEHPVDLVVKAKKGKMKGSHLETPHGRDGINEVGTSEKITLTKEDLVRRNVVVQIGSDTESSIEGMVIDPAKGPLKGAKVHAFAADGVDYPADDTDDEGKFEIKNLPFGKELTVVAERSGVKGAHTDKKGDDGLGKQKPIVLTEDKAHRTSVVVSIETGEMVPVVVHVYDANVSKHEEYGYDEAAIHEVKVSARDTEGGVMQQVETNERGDCRLMLHKSKQFEVVAEKDGYKKATHRDHQVKGSKLDKPWLTTADFEKGILTMEMERE